VRWRKKAGRGFLLRPKEVRKILRLLECWRKKAGRGFLLRPKEVRKILRLLEGWRKEGRKKKGYQLTRKAIYT
jgi:hypothetical protein